MIVLGIKLRHDQVLHAFKQIYNQSRIVERHGYQTPPAVRAAQSRRS
jgi:hypothetical protein